MLIRNVNIQEYCKNNTLNFKETHTGFEIEGTTFKKNTISTWSKKGVFTLSRDEFIFWQNTHIGIPSIKKYTVQYLIEYNITCINALKLHEKLLEVGIRLKRCEGEWCILFDMDEVYPHRRITREPILNLMKRGAKKKAFFIQDYNHETPILEENKYLQLIGGNAARTDHPDWLEFTCDALEMHKVRMSKYRVKCISDLVARGINISDIRWYASQERYISPSHALFDACIAARIPEPQCELYEIITRQLPGAIIENFTDSECTLKYAGREITGQYQFIRSRVAIYHNNIEELFTPKGCIRVSKIQQNVANILDELGIVYTVNDRTIISPREIDLYIPSHKIGFEINGVAFHASNGIYGSIDQKRHIFKKEAAQQQDIKLIHICESEIAHKPEIVKSFIRMKLGVIDRKIFARKTTTRVITSTEAHIFHDAYHMAGNAPASKHVGIFYGDEIVAVMSVSNRKIFNKNSTVHEIVRYTVKGGVVIVGGLSKAVKAICNEFEICELTTFVDMDKYTGDGYISAGFTHVRYTSPGFYYVDSRSLKRYHRVSFQKHKLVEQYPELAHHTAEEIMTKMKFFKIWTCGNRVLSYKHTKLCLPNKQ